MLYKRIINLASVVFIFYSGLIVAPFAYSQNMNLTINFDIGDCSDVTSEVRVFDCFGESNVVSSYEYDNEGEEFPVTIIYPNSEAKKLTVFWADEKRTEVLKVNIDSKGKEWILDGLYSIGQSLKDLQNIYGKPFAVRDFDFDEGGEVIWSNNKLSEMEVYKRSKMYFKLPLDLNDNQVGAVTGQGFFCSKDAIELDINMSVKEISLYPRVINEFTKSCSGID